MDQLKPILEQCKKHMFWIVTGVSVILGCVGFFMASSNLQSLFDSRKSTIEGHYGDIDKVRLAMATHPNAKSDEKMDERIALLASDVRKAWVEQYRYQAPLLKWPDIIKKDTPDLIRKLEKYRPIELKTTYPNEPRDIAKGQKKAYARYFDSDMPRIAKIIGVNWKGEATSQAAAGGGMYGGGGYGAGQGGGEGDDMYGGGMGGMGAGYGGGGYGGGMYGAGAEAKDSDEPVDLVTWPETSQNELLTQIRMWQGDTPNIYEILYTQENMWILEGLLNIIKTANGNAQANFQCAVKEIEFIRIGAAAIGQAGQIDGVASAASSMYGGGGYDDGGFGAGGSGGEGAYGGEGYDDMYSAGMGGDDYGDEGPTNDPADRRYVDANFAPVAGEMLRTSMQSGLAEDAYFAVAKRVPVRMRVKIDQREVPKFLAHCGSNYLTLEVRQVRIGDTVAAAGPGGASGGMYGEGGAPGAGGIGSFTMDGDGGGYGGDMYGSGAAAASAGDGYDLDLEIYGIVYLFNPVNIDQLGLDEITGDTELKDTVGTEAPNVQPKTEGATAQDAAGGDRAGRDNAASSGQEAAAQGGDNADAGGADATAPPASGDTAGGEPAAGN